MASFFRRFRAALGGSMASETVEADGLRLRPMHYSDLSAVMAIENASFGSPWRLSTYARAVTDGNHNFFVAELDAKVIGYAGFWVEGKEAHIAKVAVHHRFRRRGFGTALLRHCLDHARCQALTQAFLEVRRANHAAQQLYERFGFKFERVQPNTYPDNGEDALILVLDGLLEPKAASSP